VAHDWDAFCINVGSETKGREIWYPASQLTIVDWQFVKEKMQHEYSDQMIKKGEKRPQQNKGSVRNAMKLLGLTTSSFYQVRGLKFSHNAELMHVPVVRTQANFEDRRTEGSKSQST
jgi:hypothetical protein